MATKAIITRRLFRYEFVIRTRRSVRENIEILDNYLSKPQRPHGLHFADPRLTGHVGGSTFELRPWEGLAWGSQVPKIEGYFVPSEEGSDVLVSVGFSAVSNWLWFPIGAFAIASVIGFTFDAETGYGVALAAVVVFGLFAVPPLIHGSHTADILGQVFSGSVPPN